MSKPNKLTTSAGKIIAIDGPAGSGKSTTARLLAARLGYIYLDTGAMYRAITLFAIRNNIASEDGPALEAVARKVTLDFKMEGDINRVFLNGEDVTEAIRSSEVTATVSAVSAHAGVRRAMVKQQRDIARAGNIVAEGRDTTSVVFPDADLKVYLEASLKERARRRLVDFSRMKVSSTLEEQEKELTRRDSFDSNRTHSPLTRTSDSVVIDTTNLTVEEQVERIIKLAKKLFAKI